MNLPEPLSATNQHPRRSCKGLSAGSVVSFGLAMIASNRSIPPRVTYCFVRARFYALADFAYRHPADQERKTRGESENGPGTGPVDRSTKSAGTPMNPRTSAVYRKKKGQRRVVGLG